MNLEEKKQRYGFCKEPGLEREILIDFKVLLGWKPVSYFTGTWKKILKGTGLDLCEIIGTKREQTYL